MRWVTTLLSSWIPKIQYRKHWCLDIHYLSCIVTQANNHMIQTVDYNCECLLNFCSEDIFFIQRGKLCLSRTIDNFTLNTHFTCSLLHWFQSFFFLNWSIGKLISIHFHVYFFRPKRLKWNTYTLKFEWKFKVFRKLQYFLLHKCYFWSIWYGYFW